MKQREEERWALPAGVTVRLLLVRHGEPEPSAHGRCYGKLDVALSDRGREQMKQTARELAAAPVAAIYSSPRRRARQSAHIIADVHGLPLIVEDRLSELDFGDFEGLTYDQVAARDPEFYRAWMDRPTEVTFPGGESFDIMRTRVIAALERIRELHRNQTVAVVTHGGVNRIILAEDLGIPAHRIFRLDQSYGGLSVV